METLEQFIQSNPHRLELKRALAVQMSQRGHSYREIRDVLQVSVGFITASRQRYERVGVDGLRSNYWGTLRLSHFATEAGVVHLVRTAGCLDA